MTSCKSGIRFHTVFAEATFLQELKLISCKSGIRLHTVFAEATFLQELKLTSCKSGIRLHTVFAEAMFLQELKLTSCKAAALSPAVRSVPHVPAGAEVDFLQERDQVSYGLC